MSSPNRHVDLNSNTVSADLDGERVLLDISSGKYYGLNSLGSEIYELIDDHEDPVSIRQIVSSIQDRYPSVAIDRLEKDVVSFIDRMVELGLFSEGKVSEIQ